MTNKAAIANSAHNWNELWADPEQQTWRAHALAQVYARIVALTERGALVHDIGGGAGMLAEQLVLERDCIVEVWDHSSSAADACAAKGIGFQLVDLREQLPQLCGQSNVVSTELLEHLPDSAVERILRSCSRHCISAMFSVPNNRLGPEEEAQHERSYTAKQFLDLMRSFWGAACRVEVLGGYLLAVCGEAARKRFTLSFCMPVRDEERDIERTLASFRGVADEMVIGIDCRSKDRTREIAERYADDVFTIDDPRGPEDDLAPKVHFAHVRNRCLDRCTSDWVFMSEGHEWLKAGVDELLALDSINPAVMVLFVLRTGVREQWGFPWLHRNDSRIRYKRQSHNALDFPTSFYMLHMPGVKTKHERHDDNEKARKEQRRVQNRLVLTDDWVNNKNENSLMYLGSEWAPYNPDKAVERLREFLAVNRSNGSQRYHARLQCARLLTRSGKRDDARMVLLGAEADDWSRVEHWFYLGDLATLAGELEKAVQWYLYASTRIGNPPFSPWWIDTSIYGYLTAQRLVETYAALGQLEAALGWAEKTLELMTNDDDGFPEEALDEARRNIDRIQEALK